MSETTKLMGHHLKEALAVIEECKFLLDYKRFNQTVRRLYVAGYHALRALGYKDGFCPDKHEQLLDWFYKSYIASGEVENVYGMTINKLFVNRCKVNTRGCAPYTKEMALSLFNETSLLVKKIISYIKGLIVIEVEQAAERHMAHSSAS